MPFLHSVLGYDIVGPAEVVPWCAWCAFVARDKQNYSGVLLDNDNLKPLCILHFNAKQKYLGIFDENKNDTRHAIYGIEAIWSFLMGC